MGLPLKINRNIAVLSQSLKDLKDGDADNDDNEDGGEDNDDDGGDNNDDNGGDNDRDSWWLIQIEFTWKHFQQLTSWLIIQLTSSLTEDMLMCRSLLWEFWVNFNN